MSFRSSWKNTLSKLSIHSCQKNDRIPQDHSQIPKLTVHQILCWRWLLHKLPTSYFDIKVNYLQIVESDECCNWLDRRKTSEFISADSQNTAQMMRGRMQEKTRKYIYLLLELPKLSVSEIFYSEMQVLFRRVYLRMLFIIGSIQLFAIVKVSHNLARGNCSCCNVLHCNEATEWTERKKNADGKRTRWKRKQRKSSFVQISMTFVW